MKIKILLFISLLFSLYNLKAVDLPLTFEEGTYNFTNFDGGVTTIEFNPNQSGLNTSSKVAKMVKNAGQTWAGSFIDLSNPIDFTKGKIFKMKFHSPRIGALVLLKFENLSDAGISHEVEVPTTIINDWEELTFDFRTIDDSQSYQRVVIIIDNGIMGDGSENFTFYFDDIMQDNVINSDLPDVPIDFESSAIEYDFMDFDGGVATVVDNPNSSGVNSSSKVAKMVKNAGEVYGGSYLDLVDALDFVNNNTFKMTVYAPKAGTRVLLKVEFSADPGISYEQEVLTTTANEWEELIFDYSEINNDNDYDRIVIIFENGTMGDGSDDFTYYFDNIDLVQIMDPPTLPVNFESKRVDYSFTDFGGNVATVVDNPDKTGINLSSKVVQFIKNDGEDRAGSYLTLPEPIDFSTDSVAKMKVYAPKTGAKVLFRVENISDNTVFYEKEVLTTVNNRWEELSFDFSEIDKAKEYQKVILIFESDSVGDGSIDFTYFIDDIKLENESMTRPLEPAPEPSIYNPYRVLTVFSDVNGQKPNTDFFAGNADSTETQLFAIDGDAVLEYTNFQQITMVMEEEYDLNYLKFVHVDIYPTESFDVQVKPMSRFRRRYIEYIDTVNLIANQWNTLEIPYKDFKSEEGDTIDLRRFQAFRLEMITEFRPTIYVDNVYLFDDFVDNVPPANLLAEVYSKTDKTIILSLTGEDNSGEFYFDVSYGDTTEVHYAESGMTIEPVITGLNADTEYTFTITAHDNDGNVSGENIQQTVRTDSDVPAPAEPAPTPGFPADEVLSVFSDSYTQTTQWAFGSWNQQTLVSIMTIEDNQTIKMTNFNYQGIELNGNIPDFDASTSDSLHLDVWTPNAPSLELTIISESTNGKFQAPVNIEFEPRVWNRIDIPISEFIAALPEIELDNLIQFKFTSPDHVDKLPLDDIIYMDNLMFTGVDIVGFRDFNKEDIQVYTRYGSIVINTRNSTGVMIFNLSGMMVYSGNCNNHLNVDLERGLYIVKAGSYTVKCFVME